MPIYLNQLISNTTKKLIGSEEYIHGKPRWCLWLVGANPSELRSMPKVMERIEKTKQMRLASRDEGARKLASRPSEFRDTNNPAQYLVVPSVSSEKRTYIPIGFLDKDTIPTNLVHTIPNATLYHFGVLSSLLHMTWVKYVCGRLESRYRYSNTIVYNNFPWAENPSEAQKQAVERAAEAVLAARVLFPTSSLADLYDPLTMPPALVKAHQSLDRAVEKCYRAQPFGSDEERITFLFALYEQYTAPLTAEAERAVAGKKSKHRSQKNP